MRTTEERLRHDVKTAISAVIVEKVGADQPDIAKAIWKLDDAIIRSVLYELRIRWTIIERPRKQKTLRQES